MTTPIKHFVTVDAIITDNGKIVLIQRQNAPFRGMWALPGGFVDENETVRHACMREAQEETGLIVTPQTLIDVYSEPKRDPRGYVISVLFSCHVLKGELKAGDDAAKAKWFQLKQLPPMAFDHEKMIQDWLEYERTGSW